MPMDFSPGHSFCAGSQDSRNLVVEYKYDAWGRPLSTTGTLKTTLGAFNPFRYRGYVYDVEIESYYLRSRYYNAQIMRFMNTDVLLSGVMSFSEKNIYAYCSNNPGCKHIIGADVAGNPQKSNKIWLTGNSLIYKGKFYRLGRKELPPSPTGEYLSAMPKTIARGKGSVLFEKSTEEKAAQLGRYALDSKGIMFFIKDLYGRVEAEVSIIRRGYDADYASIVFHKYSFVTNDPLAVGLVTNGEEDSGPMSLISLTSDGAYYRIDGRTEFLPNEDGWITRALDNVVMQ